MKDTFVPVAWDALGDVEAMRGDRDAAVAAYRRAEESNPHC
jgi:predicted negative regulator of RcsB-dependent stress response